MADSIFLFFYNFTHHSAIFDAKVIFLAVYFIFLVILLAGLFLIFYRKSWRESILVFGSGFVAWGIAKILKILIHTERPFSVLSGVEPLFRETGYAFPSGHTAVAAALAFALFFINKKVGYVFMLFALLIGLARVIAGVHFPIDILGGFILGALISYLVAYFVKNV